jgi:hypothetical protein
MQSDAGKGSGARPFSVDKKTYEENWDRIFKRHEDLKGTVDKLNKQLDNNKIEKLKK